jgi:uracil-DNA glycosylase
MTRDPNAPSLLERRLGKLSRDARACTHCSPHLPLGPRPVFQVHVAARILVAAQAPGTKVHVSGRPFTDASGERLRAWMGLDAGTFYDPLQLAILPMGFCYPGRGAAGDLPPRAECAKLWRPQFLDVLRNLRLTLIIGQYARNWHLPHKKSQSLTATVRAWRQHDPQVMLLPHPSPRNNIWLKKNPWFDDEIVPELARRVRAALS